MTTKRQGQQQIPSGNDNQEGKDNSRFPPGMTTKGARATEVRRLFFAFLEFGECAEVFEGGGVSGDGAGGG